jgi:hypothetical protein
VLLVLALKAVGVGLPLAPFVLLAALVAGPMVSVWVMQRLTLCLPAAAVGDARCLSLSWKATKGNAFRLLSTSALVALPLVAATLASVWPVAADAFRAGLAHRPYVPPPTGYFDITVGAAASTLYYAVFAVMQSRCYTILVRGGAADDPR